MGGGATEQTPIGPDAVAQRGIGMALRRVVVGYRIVGCGWLLVLAAIGVATEAVPAGLALGTGALVTAWSVATVGVARRHPALIGRGRWLGIDLAVAVATVLAPLLAGDGTGSFHGGYPFSSVLLAAWAHGMSGGLVVAGILSAAATLRTALAGLSVLGETVGSILVYTAGAAVIAWGIGVIERSDARQRRLAVALADERAERLRSQERAETAAALHDSVLQTFALIQRRADDPAAVTTLARGQERALREWLSGRRPHLVGATGGPTTVASALESAAADIEARHQVRVDAVTVGDADLDDDLNALVAAATEALANAATHAEVDHIALYAEVSPERATVFVRDRGRGFDPSAPSGDRRGVAHSIVGRLRRHGGDATVRSEPGSGTEVELVLPRGVR